jgi:hypothetical protein
MFQQHGNVFNASNTTLIGIVAQLARLDIQVESTHAHRVRKPL